MLAVDKRTRDRLIEVGARIQRLRDELRSAETELDALLSNGAADEPVSDIKSRSNGTVGSKILEVLGSQPQSAMNAAEVGASTGDPSIQIPTIRATLARLAAAGQIHRHGGGRYGRHPPSAQASLLDSTEEPEDIEEPDPEF
jgi:hypothetical protein